jgi:hypothetical protein
MVEVINGRSKELTAPSFAVYSVSPEGGSKFVWNTAR